MNTETQVAPSATTQIPAADDQLNELAKPENQAENTDAKPEGDEANKALDKTIQKLQRRIDNRTRGIGERDQTIAQLRSELAQAREQRADHTDTDPSEKRGFTEEEVERRAQAKAEQQRFAESVSTKTKSMVGAGKAFDDFADLAAEVAEDLPFLDDKGRPTPFILALLDADKPEISAELMVHLARNPEVRDELQGLSERQMARKLALIEASIAKKPETRSKAPKPIDPLSGNAKGDADPSQMSDKEFGAWRKRQIAQRR